MCNLHWLHFVFLLPSGPSGTHLHHMTHKKAINQSTVLNFFCLTFGLSSKICCLISLCFSWSLSCRLLCASSSCRHTITHTESWCKFSNCLKQIEFFRHCDIKQWLLKVHYLPVWCIAPPHWQTICWSPASLCGQKMFIHSQTKRGSGGKSVVLSDLWWPK